MIGDIPGTNATVAAEISNLNVFISYSRDDIGFADQIDATLKLVGFDTTMDRHGIHAGEDWHKRLGSLIRDADTVLFVLTPSSARSDVCAWEVDEARRVGKRILPVLPGPLEQAKAPQGLAALNYILFYADPKKPGSGFGPGLTDLVQALKTDLAWLREHTRLLQRAIEWSAGGRPKNRLLSGVDIAEAKSWVGRRPKDAPPPTEIHMDFINASEAWDAEQKSERSRQLEERERLVRRAETAQRRSKILMGAFAVFAAAAIAAVTPTALQLYYSIKFGVPLSEVNYRRGQFDLFERNIGCKVNYRSLVARRDQTQLEGTSLEDGSVDVGLCERTGDIILRLSTPSGIVTYQWVSRDALKAP